MEVRKVLCSVGLAACMTTLSAQVDSLALRYAGTIGVQELKDHLSILASDAYQGRDTGKEGQKMAAAYLKAAFIEMGIPPVPAPDPASIVDGYAYGFNGHVSREGEFKCISLETGDQVWETRDVMKGSNILVDGKLLILTGSGELVLAEPSPNEFKEIGRIQALGGRCWTEPAFSNGRVYCRNSRGDLVCLDLGTSQEAG